MNTKLVALVAVIIIVIAAIGGYALLSDDDDDDNKTVSRTDGRMMIYGNYNNDDYLNTQDADDLEAALNDNTFVASEHPYADANQDGKVDQSDVEYIKKIANRESGTVVYYGDITGTPASVTLPFTNVVLVGTPTLTAAMVLGLSDDGRIQGVHDSRSTKDPLFQPIWDFADANDRYVSDSESGWATGMSFALFTKVAEKAAAAGHPIDGVVTTLGMGTSNFPEDDLTKNGYSTVRMGFGSDNDVNYYLTLGFLLDEEENAHSYAALIDSLYEKIDTLTQKYSSNLPSVIPMFVSASGMTGYVVIQPSNFLTDPKNMQAVGGQLILDGVTAASTSTEDGTWILTDKYSNADFAIASVQGAKYNATVDDYVVLYETAIGLKNLGSLDCIPDKLVLMNRNVATPVQLAYYLELFYPNDIEDGYGDTIHQQWLDSYFKSSMTANGIGANYNVKQHAVFVTYDDVKDALNGVTRYDVTVGTTENGTVSADKVKAAAGATITLTVTPAEGYAVESVSYNGTAITGSGSTYTFTMPAANVTVTATFAAVQPSGSAAAVAAQAFVSAYTDGAYGTFTVASSDDTSATVSNGDNTFTFTQASDAADQYSKLAGDLDAGIYSFMGSTLTHLQLTGSYVDVWTNDISSMATFTYLYLVAYHGDIIVKAAGYADGKISASVGVSHMGTVATEAQNLAFINAILTSIGAATVSIGEATSASMTDYAQKFADSYSGAFGTFTVTGTDAAAVATSSVSMMRSPQTIEFTSTSDAAATFASLGTAIASYDLMGTKTTAVVDTDNVKAYALNMSSMGNWTILYLVAYNGDTLVAACATDSDGLVASSGVYHPSTNATVEEDLAVVNAAITAIGLSAVSA